MALLNKLLLGILPIFAILAALIKPRLEVFGVYPARQLHPAKNIDRCEAIKGLEACEDAWVHEGTGVAYLACSSLQLRSVWGPAMLHLDGQGALDVTASKPDTLRLFDFKTKKHYIVELEGLPKESHGRVFLHGLDAIVSPTSSASLDAEKADSTSHDDLTLFVISHRPPYFDPSSAPISGAASVVEIFTSSLRSRSASHLRTFSHPLIRTPNNVVADADALEKGKFAFWVTNDHKTKVGWRRNRRLELLVPPTSEIVYCQVEREGKGEVECSVAAELVYPNGIAKGPNDLLYSGSTVLGEVTVWEIQDDKSLVAVSTIPISRPIDNIHVSPLTGSIYAATFPIPSQFVAALPKPGDPFTALRSQAAVEVWRVSNETGENQFYGNKYRSDLALSDPTGDVVSVITTAAPYKDSLLLTGFFSPHAVLCKTGETL